MNKICLHCYISGHVQGVFYRSGTQKKAIALGLTGWVRNLPDGRVEAMLCGDETKVKEMEKWLWQGPSAANVTEVISKEVSWQDHNDFGVK